MHNSSGGLVEDDVAELHLVTDPGTRALVTTTAATKFYKSECGGEAHDLVDFEVGEGALLEYLPDEAIPFAAARAVRRTRFAIAATSRLFACDLVSAGRIDYGAGERFAFDSLRSELELRVDGRLTVLDRLLADTPERVADLERLWSGHRYLGTVLAYAPDLPFPLDGEIAELLATCEGVLGGVTRREQLLCIRVLAAHAWQAHDAIHQIWAAVRPALAGKPARAIAKS